VGVPTRTPGAIHTSEYAERGARRMRREPTYAEAILWKSLRRVDLPAGHFRRQAPIGPYVVDFLCQGARLVVEVDGEVHLDDAVAARDLVRDAWLKSRGYEILRVTNDEVIADVNLVTERIAAVARVITPTPTPPRKGEGL
jgi:very-short-patch-repair endonuclease